MTVSEKSCTRFMTEQEWELRLGRHTCVELTVNAVKVDKTEGLGGRGERLKG